MTFFIQSCPRCARRQNLPIQLLEKATRCRHCESAFIARDSEHEPGEACDRMDVWIIETEIKSGSPVGGENHLRPR
ncbi:MAG: hypothetical protein P8M80_14840 [Pirellulaceae bacterium]|nr:hypothetical protein [Mariniblastus sp.]MDB4756565.1 hypothetical protein [Mariniblastus sp.]MDG2470557.1 hypothetical protein [Pirellulaceae bacterium]